MADKGVKSVVGGKEKLVNVGFDPEERELISRVYSGQGSSRNNENTLIIQKVLNKYGYELEEDGWFGDDTRHSMYDYLLKTVDSKLKHQMKDAGDKIMEAMEGYDISEHKPKPY